MRVAGVIGAVFLGLLLLGVEFLVLLVRSGTCGPTEGGGSCSMGAVDIVLLAGAALNFALAVSLIVRRRPW
jgi:hypothetical protein